MICFKEYKRMVVADQAEMIADWIEGNQQFLIDEKVSFHPESMVEWLRTFSYVLRGREGENYD